MTRRNPAFRIAIWGMTVGVILSLIGAVTFVGSGFRYLAVQEEDRSTPLAQVAASGELSGLLEADGSRSVPDPIEPSHPERPRPTRQLEIPSADHQRESIEKLERELLSLRGQVSEMARSQLEVQLTEIRHAERLLSQHQTHREIAALEQEIEALKTQLAAAPEPATRPDPAAPTAEGSASAPVNVSELKLKVTESAESPQRVNVDAQDVELTDFMTALGQPLGWNLVISPEVSGKVTCHWRDVEPESALRQLLKVHGWQLNTEGEFALIEPAQRQETPPEAVHELPTQTAALPEEDQIPAREVPVDPQQPAVDEALQDAEKWEAVTPAPPVETESTDSVQLKPPVASDEPVDSEHAREMPVEEATETSPPLPEYPAAPPSAESIPETSLKSETPRILPALPATMTQVFRPRHVSSQKLLPHVRPLLTQNSGEAQASASDSSVADILLVRDQPAVIAQVEELVRTLDVPAQSVQIEATILQFRSTQLEPQGQFRKWVSVIDGGRCPQCGIFHGADELLTPGHIRGGWLEIGAGMSCGVSAASADRVATQVEKQSAVTATAMAPVEVADRQLAEIGLAELQGFRRHTTNVSDRSAGEGEEGGLTLRLRPSVLPDGAVQLDLSPGSAPVKSTDVARVQLAAGQCVVLGGLQFEHLMRITPASGESPDYYEIIVLIEAKPVSK